MIIETREVYTCEFCRKYYKSKYHAMHHEKYCKKNPRNQHSCFKFCKHLIKDRYEYDGDYQTKGYVRFICDKTDTEMHSFIAERRGMGIATETTLMPNECKFFEIMDGVFL